MMMNKYISTRLHCPLGLHSTAAFTKSVSVVCLTLLTSLASADRLWIKGVLGNSGEQGDSLVKFEEPGAIGLGVVYDQYGTLWSGGGDRELKRYALDGRQLASYEVGRFGGRTSYDKIIQLDNHILAKLNGRLYTLGLDAPDGTKAEEMELRADRLAFNTVDGWAYGTKGSEVFRFQLDGSQELLYDLADGISDLEVGPDDAVYVAQRYQLYRADKMDEKLNYPKEKIQWLNGYWYGNGWHGTIYRFDEDVQMSPGVVLGGASGSFIGYVPCNYEITNGQGLAHLGDHLYAVSGMSGSLHLLEWQPDSLRFKIVRRIGSARTGQALAIDSIGRIWWHGGVWDWSDGPDAPLEHGIPSAGSPEAVASQGREPFGAVMLPNDVLVAAGPYSQDKGLFFSGALTGPARRDYNDLTMEDFSAMTALEWNGRTAALLLDHSGKGCLVNISKGDGRPQNVVGEIELQTDQAIHSLTSLAAGSDGQIWAAADGMVIQFAVKEGQIVETARWNRWTDDDFGAFGERIYLAYHSGRLWVSDTERNRVVVFDLSSGKPVPVSGVGTTDVAGNDMDTFNTPEAIAANGQRAVVYDSLNQRILKLELSH